MATIRTSCPGCGAALKMSSVPPPRQKLRCPKCQTAFHPLSSPGMPATRSAIGSTDEELSSRPTAEETVPEPSRGKLWLGLGAGLLGIVVLAVVVFLIRRSPEGGDTNGNEQVVRREVAPPDPGDNKSGPP